MLSFSEAQRKNELLEKFRRENMLTKPEAEELKQLIQKDNSMDAAVKALLIFALGALIGYLLTRR